MKITKPNRLLFPILLLLAVVLVGCRPKGAEKAPHWFKEYKFYEDEAYNQYLMGKINSISDKDVKEAAQIKQFYTEKNAALWTLNGYQEKHIQILMDYLKDAEFHGLSPEIFGYTSINKRIKNMSEGKIKDAQTLYKELATVEIALTEAYVQYVKDLTYGATDPEQVNGGKWKYETVYATPEFIREALEQTSDLNGYLASVQPTSTIYLALQKDLKKYISLKDSTFNDIPNIVADSGSTVSKVRLIGERLKLIQEIDNAYVPSDHLDATLMNAINRFRERRAIPTSHSLDQETIDMLNKKPQYYIDKLSVNLERNRWKLASPKDSTYIAVNIPDFMLRAYVDKKLELKERICCGKYGVKRRSADDKFTKILTAIGTESPQLYSEIITIFLNPEWGIPPGIVKNEYCEKFRRNGMAVVNKENLFFIDLRTKKQVLPESINWAKFNHNAYKVIQASGPKNALGRLKFHITKSDAVYLHDTNSKGKFKTRVRAYSHGCIRVENPMDLADLILTLNEYDEDDLEEVHIILGEEPETKKGKKFLEDREKKEEEYREKLKGTDSLFYREIRPTPIFLKKKMPVYIEYFTCFVDEEGQVNYRNDVYEKEGNIICALRKQEH